ncbi:MAG: ferredoxin:thioredoxin reductase [Candidatus Pacearchaeota archaeon]|nr:ferredoxin:thioredoxin reductase [Candidatus Pacearchaeota archaeon]
MKTAAGFKVRDAKELKKDIREYAKKTRIKVNPNSKKAEMIMKGLLRNKKMHGEVYCPCRIVTGNKEKDKEIICPCVFHRGEIELEGHCRCFLFFGK